jgi:decaprenyl-phosphate phosphoribosyltransferase
MSNPANEPITAQKHFLPAWLRLLRPKQWTKNVLVLAAPLAAGQLLQAHVWGKLGGALVAFVLISSAIYALNDARDVAADQAHPTKRFRPIASGEISKTAGFALAAVLATASLTLGYFISIPLFITLACYALLQIAYSLALKHLPVFDIAVVASGFLLRAIAGSAACGIVLSQWFLMVATFGSLFMVAGKRYSELLEVGGDQGTRKTLTVYTASLLRSLTDVSMAVVIICYSLWAFGQGGGDPWGIPMRVVSIVPLTLALFRYEMAIDAGTAGEPEQVVLKDRILQVLGLLWLIPVVLAIFG